MTYLTEYCANRLGYWYFVTGAVIPELTNTAYNVIELDVENRGWARAYRKYELRVRLCGEGGTYTIPMECDNRTWEPDTPVTLALRLDARGVPEGNYDLLIGMFEGETPIRLAIKQEAMQDDYYKIARTHVRSV